MLERFVEVFLIGVATPLTAACALPLYPGFLAYLSAQAEDGPVPSAGLAGLVVLGVVAFMASVGVVFSFLLEVSLTLVVEVVSPVAFGVLAAVSLGLLADRDVVSWLPTTEPPQSRHPVVTAFAYGFFFGAIVLPCNPGLLALFFARASGLFATPLAGFVGFLSFGFGMGLPLLVFGIVSQSSGERATRWLAQRSSAINRLTGAVMLPVALYYLLVVFDVAGIAPLVEPYFETVFGGF
ncbi:cytochrome c biogenesis CcdA family protein [Haloarchaeobius iranensis]|uniref:Cytochrome c-type biogenesis protein n=1 Tax=Haloarchaeobius iranensis TaxID=996166 RepID=A0A1G9WKW0_9EURY|nr:cytochrome C biogenesis protein [Haloarchaeobius iranensis]SDM85109.1 cytochrome c-type biogenesis protein [Haloarchaeobius iranensis]